MLIVAGPSIPVRRRSRPHRHHHDRPAGRQLMALRIGLIGAGAMGSLHARVLAGAEATELAWIADPDRASGERIAAKFGTKWLAQSEINGVDAIINAAPTQFHHEHAMATITAGLPLLVEKPLAESLQEVEDIIDAS